MKLSHILYKVDNLNASVNDFKAQGFHVEYGSKRNPHNALIYFSEGPYIELLEKAPVSSLSKLILRLIGKQYMIDRFNLWETCKPGYFEICFENHKNHFKSEMETLKQYSQKFFITSSKRYDPQHRYLKWKLLFPSENKLPFLMTYFNIDPKPINYVHPNGVVKIQKVVYGTTNEFINLLHALCKDETLSIVEGKGILEVNFKRV